MRTKAINTAVVLSNKLGAITELKPWALQWTRLATRGIATVSKPSDSIYVTNISFKQGNSPILLGLLEYFQRYEPSVGFFAPIATEILRDGVPKHVAVMKKRFNLHDDPRSMYALTAAEAEALILSNRNDELMEKVWNAYSKYKQGKEFVVIEGCTLPGTIGGQHMELHGRIAAELESPVLMLMNLSLKDASHVSAAEVANMALLARQEFMTERADVVGVVVNKVPRQDHAILSATIKKKLDAADLPFAGAIPYDDTIAAARLNEMSSELGMRLLYGDPDDLDCEIPDIMICSQTAPAFMEKLEAQNRGRHLQGLPSARPLVITTKDRADVLLGLTAAHHFGPPHFSGVVLTDANITDIPRTTDRILEKFGAAHHMLPILEVDESLYNTVQKVSRINPGILPDSASKIAQAEQLFSEYVDANAIVKQLSRPKLAKMTPSSFVHSIYDICKADIQHVVLPEAMDKRVLAAAAEVVRKGLAKITLLGSPAEVQAQAKRFNVDISGCNILDFQHAPQRDVYANLLSEYRKHKGVSVPVAYDLLSDLNVFGTMMVKEGDADAMVSGATCTTANTIRPGLWLLKGASSLGDKALVSSVFFMCLPDKVLAYADCAVNVEPSAEDLAMIAIASADTTAAFGITPRIAMLSYSTLGSGAGPQVDKVIEATKLVKQARPDLLVEGPIQYDAAVDPIIAAQKVKGENEVAGRATVCIFPDLNTGNNTYKAVQQSTGAIAIGPLMQGLAKPVNDLSRGCTVADIVNTVACTAVQSIAVKRNAEAAIGVKPAAVATAA